MSPINRVAKVWREDIVMIEIWNWHGALVRRLEIQFSNLIVGIAFAKKLPVFEYFVLDFQLGSLQLIR